MYIYICIGSLHCIHMSLFHFVPWRRLADDGGGSTRGKSTGCTPNTRLTYKLYADCHSRQTDPSNCNIIQKEKFFLDLPDLTVLGLQRISARLSLPTTDPSNRNIIQKERFFLDLPDLTVLGLQPVDLPLVEPPASSASFVHGIMWRIPLKLAWREYIRRPLVGHQAVED